MSDCDPLDFSDKLCTIMEGSPEVPDVLFLEVAGIKMRWLAPTPEREAASDMLAELRRLEWSDRDEHYRPGWCPSCGGLDPAHPFKRESKMLTGHTEQCTLAAALAKAAP